MNYTLSYDKDTGIINIVTIDGLKFSITSDAKGLGLSTLSAILSRGIYMIGGVA